MYIILLGFALMVSTSRFRALAFSASSVMAYTWESCRRVKFQTTRVHTERKLPSNFYSLVLNIPWGLSDLSCIRIHLLLQRVLLGFRARLDGDPRKTPRLIEARAVFYRTVQSSEGQIGGGILCSIALCI